MRSIACIRSASSSASSRRARECACRSRRSPPTRWQSSLRRAAIDAAELHRRTGGNPFFVTEVLAAGDGAIPPTVRDAVLARAARLSDGGTGAARCCRRRPAARRAVAPRSARRRRRCTPWRSAWPRACSRSLPNAVAFRHELARLAIEESVEPARRAHAAPARARGAGVPAVRQHRHRATRAPRRSGRRT